MVTQHIAPYAIIKVEHNDSTILLCDSFEETIDKFNAHFEKAFEQTFPKGFDKKSFDEIKTKNPMFYNYTSEKRKQQLTYSIAESEYATKNPMFGYAILISKKKETSIRIVIPEKRYLLIIKDSFDNTGYYKYFFDEENDARNFMYKRAVANKHINLIDLYDAGQDQNATKKYIGSYSIVIKDDKSNHQIIYHLVNCTTYA